MRFRRIGRQALLTCELLLATAISAGCSKDMWIMRIPEFYTPELQSVAVASFRNQTDQNGAGDIIADKLAASLMANGSYRVFNRNDLKAVMDENDLQLALGGGSSGDTDQLSKLSSVQAVLVGAVTTYSSTSNSQQRQDPVYATDRAGNSYVAGYRTYTQTRHEGNVSVTATLIRVSDGTTIFATPEPLWTRVWSEGSPPQKDCNACLYEAADSVVSQLVATFAPVRMQIKINPSKALRTATELYDNKWNYKDKFSADDEKMFVVVALPASCDRNSFRLVIVRKNERVDLAAQDIKWDRQYGAYGYLFSPKDIAAKAGPGDYEVKFYSGPEPIMRRTFKIE